MAKPRNKRQYKTNRNDEAINDFLNEVVGAVRSGSFSSMQKIAQRGIDRLVDNVAGFSDYTGVLINSYQAAVMQHGKLNTNAKGGRYGSNFDAKGTPLRHGRGGKGNTFKNSRGSTILITSLGKGIPISFRTEGNKGKSFIIQKRRNPASREKIRNRYRKSDTKPYFGHGMNTSNIRSYVPTVQIGYEVVFDNPTPYAKFVQENNPGSTVLPVGTSRIMPRGLALSITSSEIYNATRKARQKNRRKK